MTVAAAAPWTAARVKYALRSRHPGYGGQMPGPWTCVEEWRGIDLLAVSAWSSAQEYARVGYEVKVSRADLRSELLNPAKRAANVAWCNAFYLAVPSGLITEQEMTFEEPEWDAADFAGERCPGFAGERCRTYGRRKTHRVYVVQPSTHPWPLRDCIVCPTCGGKGVTTTPRVLLEAPTLWVPRDVGLVVVDGRGCSVLKESPRRSDVPELSPHELGQLVRYVSMRPDPRHRRAEVAA